ncbi:unnamed protein product [Choristocarpus tenellus]
MLRLRQPMRAEGADLCDGTFSSLASQRMKRLPLLNVRGKHPYPFAQVIGVPTSTLRPRLRLYVMPMTPQLRDEMFTGEVCLNRDEFRVVSNAYHGEKSKDKGSAMTLGLSSETTSGQSVGWYPPSLVFCALRLSVRQLLAS